MQGRFEILLLRGSYTINEANGVTTKTGGLSISLVGPDGRVVGGSVAGWITAANPIQVSVNLLYILVNSQVRFLDMYIPPCWA